MNAAAPTVRTSAGIVRGSWRGGSAVFLGIPYAQPPVGPRRFGAPVPVEPWVGVRDATRPGPTPQRRPLLAVTTIPEPSVPGEDVLNVSVWTPAPGEPVRRLPVLVWIHGGGFVAGSPASPWYDGSAFARDGVVTVTVSYRLGIDGFGWMADAPQNRGLLDQVAALEWVAAEIAAFGGDPAAVTIAGQSAGGGSVMALLAAPRAQHLFGAAVAQSGAGRSRSLEEAAAIGRELARAAGVPPTRAGWAGLDEKRVLDVQFGTSPGLFPDAADPVTFARNALWGAGSGLPFAPVVDGDLLPRPVEDALAHGVGADKPLLAGATAHEFTAVLSRPGALPSGLDAVDVLTRAGLPAGVARAFVAAHRELADPALPLGQLVTEQLFRLPLLRWVDARAAHPVSSQCTWLYDFRWCSPVTGLAAHCLELPFVWDLLGAEGVARSLGEAPPQALADRMHGAWVRFVREGDPGWPAGEPGIVFDEPGGQAESFEADRLLAATLADGPAPTSAADRPPTEEEGSA